MMSAMPAPRHPDTTAANRVGLCATCRFAEIVNSSRGSTFYRCTLAATNPSFPRYPALPVRLCAGYEPEPAEE
jgi:hypothetical protein